MSRYKRNKNRLESFLQTERGQRTINFAYSIGAAIVILGAMFKLLHLPFGNELLFVGMVTEVIVFTISAFDKPVIDYSWDKVFPALGNGKSGDSKVEKQNVQVTYTPTQGAQSSSQVVYESQQSKDYPGTPGYQSTQNTEGLVSETPQTEEYRRQMEKLIAETERMGKQLEELNEVYARMLKAMSANRDN